MTNKHGVTCTACGKTIADNEPVFVTLGCDGYEYQTHCRKREFEGAAMNCAIFRPSISKPVENVYDFADPRWLRR